MSGSDPSGEAFHLASGDATATVALRGSEPLSWRVGGRELLWHGDPAHWSYRAPLLFPVVGASLDGTVRVDDVSYPMAQHGFARTLPFDRVAADPSGVHLRLVDGPGTRAHYPYGFALDVVVTLGATSLDLAFAVENRGDRPMPYGLGFHPAFPWPFAAPDRSGHRVVFERDEEGRVPEIAPGGLLARRTRGIPLDGGVLPLDPAMFTEALVLLEARSRSFAFEGPSGARIEMTCDGFPHLAVWSRPDAPFLSLEAWTAHADWEDSSGDLAGRASMIVLGPGEIRRHAVRLAWRDA